MQELKELSFALSESESSEFPCFLETETSQIQSVRQTREVYTLDALPVQDYHTRRALNKINSLPHASELDPSSLPLATDLYYLRRKYVPTMTFQFAHISRGTFTWLREKIRTAIGVVFLWKKRDPSRLWISESRTLNLDPLIASHWSAVFFWNTDGTSPQAQPLRSLEESPSHPDAPRPPDGPEPSSVPVPDEDMPDDDAAMPDPCDQSSHPPDDAGSPDLHLPPDDPMDPPAPDHPGLAGSSVFHSPPDGPSHPVSPD